MKAPNPKRTIRRWTIFFMIALAFVGVLRGIPFYWRLIDCSVGVIGLIPLVICYQKIRLLERMTTSPVRPAH